MIVINLVLSGVILIGLGFVGEYLIRIVELGSARPPYVVREAISGSKIEDRTITELPEWEMMENE